jgi:subtilase family serine protease
LFHKQTLMSIWKVVLALAAVPMAAPLLLGQPSGVDRIVRPINNAQVLVLRGNVRPWARAEDDRGKVNDSLRLDHITVIFRPSQGQQSNLTNLLQQLQNPSSSNYHKWLTPEQFGNEFGLTQNDLNQVVSWLENQGFVLDEVARSHMWVVFSGTAGQVEDAFHTEIHRYVVHGKTYYANASDPVVPSAIAGVVLGFRGLDNYRPKPRGTVRRVTPAAAPHFTSSISGNHYLAPNDFATIYDLNSLYHSGINGAGQSIAVLGQTDIYTNDLTAFRSAAGLAANSPTVTLIPGSADPGISKNELSEADLDLEWSGAIAPDATVIYVNSGTANGVFDSLQYAIDQGLAPVVSITYGNCEQDLGAAFLQTLAQEAEQANAEGMTIVSASGDNGATDCDYSTTSSTVVTIATHGLAVDAPASLPYVTGVGGTEFNEGSGNYWSTSNNNSSGSALSYIPETAWNDTSNTNGLAASGGGASGSGFFAKPSWQTGTGVPSDSARDVPDVAFAASPNHDAYLICSDGSCVNGFRESDQTLNVVGGTSTGAPVMAAVVALINEQTNSATGQGNINYVLYPLAAQQPGAFHDITTGNNEEPCQKGSTDCPNGGNIGYPAGAGYDQVTGLGSLDVANLVAEWSSVASSTAQNGPNFKLSISPASLSIGSGQSGSATVTVSALNGFSGTVSLACAVSFSVNGDTCAVSPTSVSTSGTATVSVTISSQAVAPYPLRKVTDLGALIAGGLILTGALLLGIRGIGSRLKLSGAVGLLLLCIAAGGLSCGGGSAPSSTSTTTPATSSTTTSSSLQVAPVSSTVTVTGSATANGGAISRSTLLAVTVQ